MLAKSNRNRLAIASQPRAAEFHGPGTTARVFALSPEATRGIVRGAGTILYVATSIAAARFRNSGIGRCSGA